MDTELMEKARVGLQAWQDGDLSVLEELLDPEMRRFGSRAEALAAVASQD